MSIATDSVTEVKTAKARKAVQEMPEYHPPLAGRDALRLDFNENTFSPSPKVLRARGTNRCEALWAADGAGIADERR